MPMWGALRARRSWPVPWVVPLAVVFTLGTGEAAAQLIPDNTFDGNGLQVEVESEPVAEGESVTITVTLKASVTAGTASATPVTVTVEVEPKGSGDATAEVADVSLNPGTATLTFPANTTGSAVTYEISGNVLLQTNHDPDAEDETIVLAVSASGGDISIAAGGGPGEEPLRNVTLDDDETQSYTLALAPGAQPREGRAFEVTVRAVPAHVDDSKTLTLQIDDSSYALDTDDAAEGAQSQARSTMTIRRSRPRSHRRRTTRTGWTMR